MFESFELDKITNFGRKVIVEIPGVPLETDTSILVEWNGQNAWFSKKSVKITRQENSVIVEIPRWLFERKYS
jgi:hypothetical protein